MMFFLALLLSQTQSFSDSAHAGDTSFEVLSDMDLGFLLSHPKMPWGEDPFIMDPGYAQVPSTEDKFTLNGIFFTKNDPMAVVNGKTVHEGDLVGDRRISEIGVNYVILKKRNSEIELTLPPLVDENAERKPGSDLDDSLEEAP